MPLSPQQIDKPTARRVFTIEAPLKKGKLLTLRYVPDRDMVMHENFQEWIAEPASNNLTIEELATQIGGDFYDKILPHYMDLNISYDRENGLVGRAYLVHHQPDYKLPEILHAVFNR